MPSYETIPAAEDGLLATPKPQASLGRLVAGAAVVSFALGALAATATSTKIQTVTSFNTDYDHDYIIRGCHDAFESGRWFHVDYYDGPAGSGWYCGDNYPTDNFNLVYETPTQAGYIEDDSKFGQDNYWLADPLKGGKINYMNPSYQPAAIHSSCDAAEYSDKDGYKCLDDDFAASDMAPLGFAYQVTRAATATYSGGDQDIFDGGYFYFNPDTKSFFWNYDGSNEVEYDYDYNDQKNFPGAVKLWKKDGSNTGWYKVYNNCEDGIGKDGKVGCYLHFYCLNWNTDDLGSDC